MLGDMFRPSHAKLGEEISTRSYIEATNPKPLLRPVTPIRPAIEAPAEARKPSRFWVVAFWIVMLGSAAMAADGMGLFLR